MQLAIIDKTGRVARRLLQLSINFQRCCARPFAAVPPNTVADGAPDPPDPRTANVLLVCEQTWSEISQSATLLRVLTPFWVVTEQPPSNAQATGQHEHVFFCHLDEIQHTNLQWFAMLSLQSRTIQRLSHESHCYREMVDACPDYVFIRDRQGRIVFANAALAGLHTLQPKDMIGQTYTQLTGDVAGGEQVFAEDLAIFKSGQPYYQHEDFYQDESGVTQWNRVSKKRIDNHDGSDHLILGVATDLTEWKKNEAQLQQSEARYRELYHHEQVLGKISELLSLTEDVESLLDQVAELIPGLFNTPHGGLLRQASSSALMVLTTSGRQPVSAVVHQSTPAIKSAGVFTTVNNESLIASAIVLDREHHWILYALRDTQLPPFELPDAELLCTVANQCRLMVSKIELHRKIKHQAYHDPLSSLANRLSFECELDRKLAIHANHQPFFAVVFFDLDGFKSINDTYGHLMGDRVLQAVSHRLSAVVGKQGFLARMGGDEFAIITHCCNDRDDARALAENILLHIKQEIRVDANRFSVGASIGIVCYPQDGVERAVLMRRADSAMYHAKADEHCHLAFFIQDIEAREQRRRHLEEELASALLNNTLSLHYQPQIDLTSGKVCGVEALSRWHHDTLGNIPPAEFVIVAEQSQLIGTLGDWVINTALQQARRWQHSGVPIKTAINLSPKQFERADFGKQLVELLCALEFDNRYLQVEVTESTLMSDLDRVIRELQVIRSAGVSVAIDDFGTGYSSLSYLQHLPLDVLKIDRSFVNNMDTDTPESSLISVITQMAKHLNLCTVVEGVETEAQYLATRQLGCDIAQGWFFYKAMSVADVTSLLKDAGAAPERKAA